MNARWPLPLVILAAWFGPLLAAAGQEGGGSAETSPSESSHILLPSAAKTASGSVAEQFLDFSLMRQQLLAGQQQRDIERKLRGLSDEERTLLSKQVAALQKSAAAGRNPKENAQQTQAMLGLLRSLQRQGKVGPLPGTDDQIVDALIQSTSKERESSAASAAPPAPSTTTTPRKPAEWKPRPGANPASPPRSPAPPKEKADNQLQVRFARQVADWAERMERDSALARSPGWKRMMEGLNRYRQGGSSSREGGSADSWFSQLGLETRFGKLISLEGWSFRPKLPPTDLSGLITSPGGSGASRSSAPGVPGTPSAGLWRGLFWIVLAGAGGAFLWWMLSGKNLLGAAQTGAAKSSSWSAGPWPVPPEHIRTREHLIQAFEHLSLLLLGKRARNWNHREIAISLATPETPPARRDAALELASLYESARYAPATQALPEDDLATARRHLCLLAGVSA